MVKVPLFGLGKMKIVLAMLSCSGNPVPLQGFPGVAKIESLAALMQTNSVEALQLSGNSLSLSGLHNVKEGP